jgi:hypothetical protein
MKQWKKTVGIVVAVLAIYVAAAFLFGNEKECCLCNSPSYSAPCLVDLETGDILQLPLDGPTTSGPEGQTDVSTFSFIRFHTVIGIKQTAPNMIELKIPSGGALQRPSLCRQCRQLLPQGYNGRYVLADLENNVLLPIVDVAEYTIRSYSITTMLTDDSIILSIQQS